MDIGCYSIQALRMVFGEEPVRVSAAITRDPRFGNIDMLTSAILEFPSGHCVFTCSTQIMQQQSMCFYGTTGRIQPEIPFNATPGGTSRIFLDDGRRLTGRWPVVDDFPGCDQDTIQAQHVSRAIREGWAPLL